LEAVLAAADGLGDPEARRLVENSPGAAGSLTGLLEVPPQWSAAVAAALGPWSGAVAFADSEGVETAVGQLKAAGRGGVPVVGRVDPVDRRAVPAREVAAVTGLEALIDLLPVDRSPGSAATALAESLLGDVLVAEGWSAAWALVRRYPQVRAVTPEGDLISRDGIRAAQPDGATPTMVESAEISVDRAERELARVASRLNTLRRQFEQSRESERNALETLETLEAKLAGATEALGRAARTGAELESELARLTERRSALTAAINERAGQIERLSVTIAALEGEEAIRQGLLEELTTRRRNLAEAREQARAAWQEAAEAASAAAERRTFLEARKLTIEGEIGGPDPGPIPVATLQALANVERLARRAIEVVRSQLENVRERQDSERGAARAVGEELSVKRQRHEQLLADMAGWRERLSGLAIEQTETRMRREAIVEALRRDIDASEAEALAAPEPDATAGVSAVELLASRQAELRRMGPVNPLAAEEYRSLAERHDFMAAQLADLETSRAELRKVMKALDEEIETQFLAAFEEVAAAYQEHFGILFPGGRGRMRLSDPDQPLTSGVEIEAQPMGKKIGKLSLLSGGERSLAALAFLFGVFKARPSPFYVLDEVEAALDDSNLRRFLRLVEAFRGESQLILITHQQQTMEAADVLYGVTMEPGGSSQVIAKELASVHLRPGG
ncbi:MAG TPA: AAA family ATPase, partial [Acidimicrobiia bacterium]|nr:AAA family ATPase [Acidimicrobiia bacterium]